MLNQEQLEDGIAGYAENLTGKRWLNGTGIFALDDAGGIVFLEVVPPPRPETTHVVVFADSKDDLEGDWFALARRDYEHIMATTKAN